MSQPLVYLKVEDPPQKRYPFGRIVKRPFREWDTPMVFSQEPLQVMQVLLRWQAQAGYVAYTDLSRALYGLAGRRSLFLHTYGEKPFSPVEMRQHPITGDCFLSECKLN